MAQAKKEIEGHLGIVEQQLAGREWMVGERYSLVEVRGVLHALRRVLTAGGGDAAARGGGVNGPHAWAAERAGDEAGGVTQCLRLIAWCSRYEPRVTLHISPSGQSAR